MHRYIRRFLLLLAILASSRPVLAQPGCGGGVLADPRAYFFWSIQRAEGAPANDYADVMRRSGYPSAPGPNVRVPDGERFGITQWIDASGSPRGRLSLPTAVPDENGYYTHTVQYIRDAVSGAGLEWTWIDMGGPPYGPRPCGSGPSVPPVTPASPASDQLLEAIAALRELRQTIDLLRADVDGIKNRPFPCFSGRLGGFAPLTLCPRP